MTARLTEDQDRGAGQVLRRDFLLRVSSAQEPRRGPFRSLASSNPVSNFISVANFCLRRIPALPPTVGRQSHDSCLPLCAGGILTIPPVHPVRPASSLAAAGAPRRLLRLVGPPHARIAPLACPPQDRALLPERHETIQGSSATSSSRSFSSCPSLCFCFWFAASFSLVLCSCRLVSCGRASE